MDLIKELGHMALVAAIAALGFACFYFVVIVYCVTVWP